LPRHEVAQRYRSHRTRRSRRVLIALIALPFLFALLAAPAIAPTPVSGDQLSDAIAQQKQLEATIAAQKALLVRIGASQTSLQGKIVATRTQLNGITEDLTATLAQVASLTTQAAEVQATYEDLVTQLDDLQAQLDRLESHEAAKKVELGQLKSELAGRIRTAYDDSRTSLLETFLSGATFTDMLAAMSAQLDAADQDRVLAGKIADDRATLFAIHQTVLETLASTDQIRQATAVQKQALDLQLADLRDAKARLQQLQQQSKAALASEQGDYAKLATNKTSLAQAIAKADAAKKALQAKIDALVAAQFQQGGIPSQYSGSLIWPMSGSVSQNFGCTGFSWEPPLGSCAHFHQGIDLVAAYGTPVHAAGAGRIVYIGWNYADGYDPAWIVVIAHASNLTSWYAHLQPTYPVHTGDFVNQGQLIGYEGNTGHSTGAHLHWAVALNSVFVNPRLFL
jgi:murein DD-endopeptidase MepM/ murein hydrolase activator NlpD